MKLTEIQQLLEQYDPLLTAAYVRGELQGDLRIPRDLAEIPLEALTDEELALLCRMGEEAGLRLYHFKRREELPRVRAVLGILSGIMPGNLLDVGSGRGAFLFPFLNRFQDTPVTAVDLLPRRVQMLGAVSRGGVDRLTVLHQDICTWEGAEKTFDAVTLLEVLEHIPDVQQAVTAAVSLARRCVVVSVPSKPDDNPEHIHLLTRAVLTELFENAGCSRLHFGGVNGHLILTAMVGDD
jgi:2-polyprenyl-3-methyl-5-hydroxy-6-metoxy-1,4-benzoquinol methylase